MLYTWVWNHTFYSFFRDIYQSEILIIPLHVNYYTLFFFVYELFINLVRKIPVSDLNCCFIFTYCVIL